MLCGVWTGGDWGKGMNLRKPRRSGDEDSGSKLGLALRVFRFAEVEKDSGLIVLWISVKPGSLSPVRIRVLKSSPVWSFCLFRKDQDQDRF